jgi:hypothetical protein
MILEIDFSKNLAVDMLLEQEKIPCVCRVGSSFEVSFNSPLPVASGVVSDWELSMLEERAPAGAGGEYIYYQPGLITISRIDENKYKVVDLAFFCEGVGWCLVIKDGEYGPPGTFWDEDDF